MLGTNPVLRTLALDSYMLFGLLSHQLSTYFIFTVDLVATSSHSFKYLLSACYLPGFVLQQDRNPCLPEAYILVGEQGITR